MKVAAQTLVRIECHAGQIDQAIAPFGRHVARARAIAFRATPPRLRPRWTGSVLATCLISETASRTITMAVCDFQPNACWRNRVLNCHLCPLVFGMAAAFTLDNISCTCACFRTRTDRGADLVAPRFGAVRLHEDEHSTWQVCSADRSHRTALVRRLVREHEMEPNH